MGSNPTGLRPLKRLAAALLAAAFVLPAAAQKPAKADAPKTKQEGGVVQIGNPAVVEAGTHVLGGVVVVGAGATVKGSVDEDVAVVGGDVVIDGPVGGSVFVVGKSIELGPNAVIEGDLVNIGARAIESPAAVVKGQRMSLRGIQLALLGSLAALVGLVGALIFWLKVFASLGWAILAVILAALFADALEASGEHLAARPGLSLIAGILVLPAGVLIAATLIVSVFGIALLPLLGIGMAALVVWGYVTVGFLAGDRLFRAVQMYVAPWLACLLGVTLIQIVRWIPLAGTWIMALALVFGVGASVVALFSAARRVRMPSFES